MMPEPVGWDREAREQAGCWHWSKEGGVGADGCTWASLEDTLHSDVVCPGCWRERWQVGTWSGTWALQHMTCHWGHLSGLLRAASFWQPCGLGRPLTCVPHAPWVVHVTEVSKQLPQSVGFRWENVHLIHVGIELPGHGFSPEAAPHLPNRHLELPQ